VIVVFEPFDWISSVDLFPDGVYSDELSFFIGLNIGDFPSLSVSFDF
jgi:hypothetical protein